MKDTIIAELRKIRDAHAAKFNYDFDAIADDWMRQQSAAKRMGQRFVDLSAKLKPRHRGKSLVSKSNKARRK